MTLSSTRPPATGVRRLTATLYCYSFLDEFVLLYPVYTLLFSDTGLSVWQISSLFVLWSVTGVVLEVPSGAWADAVSRRTLLWLGPLLTAVGFALWVIVPSYWAFAVGFVLWGARGAFVSGALEALVYEELERLGAAERYARLMGRSRAVGLVAVMAAMGLAGPVLAWGGYPAVGAASVLVCLASAVTACAFPEQRPAAAHDDGSDAATLWAGLAEARLKPAVRGAILLVPAVTAVWGALDEYTPLLVRETGVPDARVPYLLLLIWAGATAGSLLAGRFERLGTGGLAWLLGVAAVALAVGAAVRTPLALGLVAVAFGGFQLATVLADVRLQQRIDDTGRATLTSVAGLGTELVTVAVYAGYAAIATRSGHGTAFVLFALPYLLTALALAIRARAGARNESPRQGCRTQ
ncbi:MFS transporter [Streptomyces sp. NPDC001286]